MKDSCTAAQPAYQYYEKRYVTKEQAGSNDQDGSDDDAEYAKRIVSPAFHCSIVDAFVRELHGAI